MSTRARASTLLLCMVLGACATRPVDADLRNMQIQEAPANAETPEAMTKGGAAASSAVKGGGGGLAVGALICAAMIPFAAPGCMAFVAPITVTAGAVGSGAIGAAVTKNTDPAPSELTARLDTAASQRQLIGLLQQRAGMPVATSAAGAPAAAASSATADAAPARPYALSVALADLRIQRVDNGKPAPLVLLALAQVQPAGSDKPVWSKTYRIISPEKRPVAEWAAMSDTTPIEFLLDKLADRIATDLAPRKS